ncbi:cell division protein FtsK [Streptomyces sp. H10-C2]|uniref:cell division protein FtsK n=1 Tax=unclassified Streptomyces TaxID=2593676 RepID=UPI0024B93A4E|nr:MULTISPECIES: cell division protein FtsK [unclassified Streptomyces]MDJ0341376.1 cell division protein FtsK [Streptomyces sp. PH10-H1]MDJ0370971.1 cell division protein FtsK [Streptomyces sp. H10-C2]
MSDLPVYDQPDDDPNDPDNEAFDGTEGAVLPFLSKRDKPADTPEPAPDEAGTGEREINLPDDDPQAEGLIEGEAVDRPQVEYPASLAETMQAKDKARHSVIPAWMKSAAQRRLVARWAVRHYAAVTGFHAVRTPLYGAKLTAYAPRGLARWTGAAGRWLSDAESRPVRLAAVHAEDAGEYMRLARLRDGRVKMRGILASLATVFGLGASLAMWVLAPMWLLALSVTMVTGALGWAGVPADRPLIASARVKFRNRKLTSDIITRAFVVAGLTNPDQGVAFPRPIVPDGDGYRVTVDLPYGKTFAHALRAQESLASGIDVAPTQVFLDKDETSARRVSMWVANQDPLAVPAGPSPLITADRVDFWKPFPWGRDERGNEVMVTMLWLSLLVGAVPRQGKTFSARTIALAAALDPFVRLIVFDGKASPDWRKFALVAHRVGFGIVPKNGIDPVKHMVNALTELKADVEDRYHKLSELPLHLCPEGKLTPELSRNKALNMPLTLVIVDEVQEYLQHPEHGKIILELLVYLARVAPAVGVSVMNSTQKPDDKACPSVLRDQHQARFALMVGAYQVSDVILGAGSRSEGLDASRLLRSHKGVGILKGMSDDSGIVRTYLADGRDAESILIRAQALREAEGTLSGDAIGETAGDDAAAATLLDDIAVVMPKAEAKQWSETVIDNLATLRPDVYGSWAQLKGEAKGKHLAAALKPFGIGTEQIGVRIDGKPVTRRGIIRAHIIAAITERNRKRPAA